MLKKKLKNPNIGDIGEAVNVEMKITTVRIVDGFAYNSKQLYVVGFDKDNNKIALYTTKKKYREGDTLVLSNAVVKNTRLQPQYDCRGRFTFVNKT